MTRRSAWLLPVFPSIVSFFGTLDGIVRYSRFQVLALGDGEWMVVQLVYANQAGKWCFRGYVVRSLDCPGLWLLCENGDTRCSLHHKGTTKAWEQNDGAIAHRPYHPGHIPSYYDTNFSHDSFIGRLNRFLGAAVQRFYFRHCVWSGSGWDRKKPQQCASGQFTSMG